MANEVTRAAAGEGTATPASHGADGKDVSGTYKPPVLPGSSGASKDFDANGGAEAAAATNGGAAAGGKSKFTCSVSMPTCSPKDAASTCRDKTAKGCSDLVAWIKDYPAVTFFMVLATGVGQFVLGDALVNDWELTEKLSKLALKVVGVENPTDANVIEAAASVAVTGLLVLTALFKLAESFYATSCCRKQRIRSQRQQTITMKKTMELANKLLPADNGGKPAGDGGKPAGLFKRCCKRKQPVVKAKRVRTQELSTGASQRGGL